MLKKKNLISVILPTYNEAGNIIALIKAIPNKLKPFDCEIIVVDDNSPDQTARLVKEYFAKDKRIHLFVRKKDKGLAKSILFGIKHCQGEYIIVMDTDFNHHPDDLPKFLSHKNKYHLIIGSRYTKGGGMENKTRYYLSLLYNLLVGFLLSLPTKDNLSGFFLIQKEKLMKFNLETIFQGYGDYFIRLIKSSQQNNLWIKEVPVFYKNRSAGQSKSRFFPMFIDYSKTVLDILLNT